MPDDISLRLLHGKNRWDYFDWKTPDTFLKAANSGIFVPFADAFEYGNAGILIIGPSEVGKTALTGRFVGYTKRAKRLAEDASTNFFDGQATYVYRSRLGYFSDIDVIRENGENYPIKIMFHLLSEGGKIVEGKTEGAIQQMFLQDLDFRPHVDKKVIEISYNAYRSIPVFTVPRYETPDKRYHAMKDILKEIVLKKK